MSNWPPWPVDERAGGTSLKHMRVLRLALVTFALVGAFLYYTLHRRSGSPAAEFAQLASGDSSSGSSESTASAAAPALGGDDQATIALYKRVLPSVVNISSTSLAFDFFYGAVPQEGQGSG